MQPAVRGCPLRVDLVEHGLHEVHRAVPLRVQFLRVQVEGLFEAAGCFVFGSVEGVLEYLCLIGLKRRQVLKLVQSVLLVVAESLCGLQRFQITNFEHMRRLRANLYLLRAFLAELFLRVLSFLAFRDWNVLDIQRRIDMRVDILENLVPVLVSLLRTEILRSQLIGGVGAQDGVVHLNLGHIEDICLDGLEGHLLVFRLFEQRLDHPIQGCRRVALVAVEALLLLRLEAALHFAVVLSLRRRRLLIFLLGEICLLDVELEAVLLLVLEVLEEDGHIFLISLPLLERGLTHRKQCRFLRLPSFLSRHHARQAVLAPSSHDLDSIRLE